MKRRGIARTTAMAMAAAMILTACGGGNTDQSANAPTGGSAQTATDNGRKRRDHKNRYRCGYGRRRCHTGSGRTAGYHIRSTDPSRIQHTDGYRR